MKINYIQCDICGNHIINLESGKIINQGHKFKFKQGLPPYERLSLDICDTCVTKLYAVTADFKFEEELANKVVEKAIDKYEDSNCQSAYLHGVEDALNAMSKFRTLQNAKTK